MDVKSTFAEHVGVFAGSHTLADVKAPSGMTQMCENTVDSGRGIHFSPVLLSLT